MLYFGVSGLQLRFQPRLRLGECLVSALPLAADIQFDQ